MKTRTLFQNHLGNSRKPKTNKQKNLQPTKNEIKKDTAQEKIM